MRRNGECRRGAANDDRGKDDRCEKDERSRAPRIEGVVNQGDPAIASRTGKLASLRLPGDGTVQRVALTEDRSPFAIALLRETRWVDRRMSALVVAGLDADAVAAPAGGDER